MKKSKLILPLIATVGTAVPVATLLTVTSCGNKYDLSISEMSHAAANALSGIDLVTNTITLDVPKVLKQVDILAENIGGQTVTSKSITAREGYSIGVETTITLAIPGGSAYVKTFELHYNNVKNKIKSTEIKNYYEGICVFANETSYDFKMTVENESKEGKTEVETKFKLYCFDSNDENNYIEVKTEKETKATKTEHKYEYKTKKSGVEEEYSIELTQKTGKNLRVEVEKEVETNDEEAELFFERLTSTDQGSQKVEYQQYSNDEFSVKTDKYLRTLSSGEIVFVKE